MNIKMHGVEVFKLFNTLGHRFDSQPRTLVQMKILPPRYRVHILMQRIGHEANEQKT